MKKIRVEDAVGRELCHDVTEMREGFKGPAFRRGHIIREEDVPHLLDLGKRTVFVWEPEAGEIHEEDCALRLAAMAPVEGAHYTGPSEGKMLLTAEREGMFRVDTALLKRINSVGDVTVCTLPDHYPVKPGARLASMRIVPLVTKEERILEAERLCAGRKLMELLPYRSRTAGVLITGSELYTGRIRDRFEPVVREKLAKYPCRIVGVKICDDDEEMIVREAEMLLGKGADLLILSGGMSVDPDDVTPAAVRRLGAEILTYGVPSQPGNMTLIAYLGDVPVLGVPGAAVSLPTTMLDVILPQVFAGKRFTREEISGLGDGGLCQQCAECRWPNCTFGRY